MRNISLIVEYFIISFIITLMLFILGIPLLRRINCGQYVRELGPVTHKRKQGTPTMGGLYIIFGTIISTIIFVLKDNLLNIQYIIMFCLPLIFYGMIGFIDDYKKIKLKNNDGISPRSKMILQIILASIYFILFLNVSSPEINIGKININLKWFYGVLILLMFIGSANAYNLTDGMDGLAGGIGIIILCGLLIIAKNSGISILIIILIGAIMAFMCYNFKKATIFMGDVGSLAIGVTLANLCIILKCEFILVIFGFILIIEALSVIVQVIFYKLTNGKRLLKMAPIHHHFELKGYSEVSIVLGFYIAQIIIVIIGLIFYYGG